jgi:hypothetical protein
VKVQDASEPYVPLDIYDGHDGSET